MIERIKELNPEAIIYEGFDKAIVGIDTRELRVIYDEDLMIETLMKEMSYEEAIDYYEFNIASTYLGDNTPIILRELHYTKGENID